jgi:uncharacterized protein (DUF697 family)
MAASKTASFFSVQRVVGAVRDEQVRADLPARLLVAGSGDGFRRLADLVTEGHGGVGGTVAGVVHIGMTGGADVTVRELPAEHAFLGARSEDTVLLAADSLARETLAAVIGEAHKARAGLVVALPARGVQRAVAAALSAGALSTELEVFEPSRLLADSRLADAVVKASGDRATSLARSLSWLRHATVARTIRRTAIENAAVGVLVVVPGADMPIMTLNQVRMVLRIGSAYGNDVEAQRAPEVLAVIGAGFGLRAVAHQGLKFIPAAGWALKGALGYAGTVALGRAAVTYYEGGVAGKLGGVTVELPDSLERRLPGPLADVVRDRLGSGRATAPQPPAATPVGILAAPPLVVRPALRDVSIEAPEEPRERNLSDAERSQDGLSKDH